MENKCENESSKNECSETTCCSSSSNCCSQQSCGCESTCNQSNGCNSSCESECDESDCCDSGYDISDMMMELVQQASAELIKERVKKKLEAVNGKKYDKIADLLVEAKLEYMKSQGSMMKQKELNQKLMSALYED